MPLFKISDFNPSYRQDAFDGEDVKGLEVYAGRTNEKIGSIHDVLVDETGRFRYLVIDTGFWIFGKKVLLPVGRCHVDARARRIYAVGIANKEQAELLPEYDDTMTVDYDYEERVRHVYRAPAVESSAPVESTGVSQRTQSRSVPYDRHTYAYDHEPTLYQMNEREHQTLRLYEERLVANKRRRQKGDVAIGKRVEADTTHVSVPVDKERVVIERKSPDDVKTTATPDATSFREGEVAHIDVYEETAEIGKQAFVREEVNVRKEVEHDTVDATKTLRREELEVDIDGKPTSF
jgi:uncharacterized protein (TIGR02271 family)